MNQFFSLAARMSGSNDCFPGERGSAGSLSVFFFHFFQKRTFGDKWHMLVQVGCPSCQPTNSVKAMKKMSSTDCRHVKLSTGLILSSSTTGFLRNRHWSVCASSSTPLSCFLYSRVGKTGALPGREHVTSIKLTCLSNIYTSPMLRNMMYGNAVCYARQQTVRWSVSGLMTE